VLMDDTKKVKVSREVVFDENAVLERRVLFKEHGSLEEGEIELEDAAEKAKEDVSAPDGGLNQDEAEGELTFQPRRTSCIHKRPRFLWEEAHVATTPPKLI
jgi:hypothetical protein